MGRRPPDNDNEVSLFPFLSILACVIGVLTLMISTLALSQLDNDVVVAAEEYEKVSRDLEEKESRLLELQDQIDTEQEKAFQQSSQKQKELAELLKKQQTIRLQLLAARKKPDELKAQPQSEQAIEKQPLEEIEKELAMHKEDIAQLVKQIEERNLPPKEAEFSVLPGGSGVGIKPYFVECTKTEIVLHRENELVRIRAGQIETDPKLVKMLDEVAGDPGAKVIFLIREDGYFVWARARRFIDSLEVPNGKLPVLGQGRIDLKYFLVN